MHPALDQAEPRVPGKLPGGGNGGTSSAYPPNVQRTWEHVVEPCAPVLRQLFVEEQAYALRDDDRASQLSAA